jgi:hypothetical protein
MTFAWPLDVTPSHSQYRPAERPGVVAIGIGAGRSARALLAPLDPFELAADALFDGVAHRELEDGEQGV